jgi:hypothetical protein
VPRLCQVRKKAGFHGTDNIVSGSDVLWQLSSLARLRSRQPGRICCCFASHSWCVQTGHVVSLWCDQGIRFPVCVGRRIGHMPHGDRTVLRDAVCCQVCLYACLTVPVLRYLVKLYTHGLWHLYITSGGSVLYCDIVRLWNLMAGFLPPLFLIEAAQADTVLVSVRLPHVRARAGREQDEHT